MNQTELAGVIAKIPEYRLFILNNRRQVSCCMAWVRIPDPLGYDNYFPVVLFTESVSIKEFNRLSVGDKIYIKGSFLNFRFTDYNMTSIFTQLLVIAEAHLEGEASAVMVADSSVYNQIPPEEREQLIDKNFFYDLAMADYGERIEQRNQKR